MTRSHKQNDRDHVGLANGTAAVEEHLPRYFAKNGHIDSDPKKVKKEGGGKGNWGQPGTEAHDQGFTFAAARRRSNSSANAMNDFKTKFEDVEDEPVFDEATHGPGVGGDEEDGAGLSKEDSAESASSGAGSVDDEEHAFPKF